MQTGEDKALIMLLFKIGAKLRTYVRTTATSAHGGTGREHRAPVIGTSTARATRIRFSSDPGTPK